MLFARAGKEIDRRAKSLTALGALLLALAAISAVTHDFRIVGAAAALYTFMILGLAFGATKPSRNFKEVASAALVLGTGAVTVYLIFSVLRSLS